MQTAAAIASGNFNHVPGALIKCARSHSHVSYHTFIITATILFQQQQRRRRGIKHINDPWHRRRVFAETIITCKHFSPRKVKLFLVTKHECHRNSINFTPTACKWPQLDINLAHQGNLNIALSAY
jgi:hypothetical protein